MKIEAIYQTSGEAEYVNDMHTRGDDVFCAFAIAETLGKIEKIDVAEAMVCGNTYFFICS